MRLQRALVALAGPMLALAGAVPALAAPSPASTACPALTNPQWNAYDGSPAQATACGLTTYPLSSETTLPDGGTQWSYATPGNPIIANYPPTGFDPVTATPAEQSLYGIPAEPPATDPAAQAQWLSALDHIKSWVKPSSFLVANPTVSNSIYSDNWSGYMDVESSGYFHYAWEEFIQPYDNSSHCTYRDETTWSGIGGDGNNDLGQDGTFIGNVKGLNEYQAWVEALDLEPMVAVNMYATPGQYFEANTNYVNGQYNWYMENYYTGVVGTFSQADSNFSGATTEFIAEDPLNLTADLANFGTLQFVWVASAVQESPVSAYPYDEIVCQRSGKSGHPW